jgi:hypothetical protein
MVRGHEVLNPHTPTMMICDAVFKKRSAAEIFAVNFILVSASLLLLFLYAMKVFP